LAFDKSQVATRVANFRQVNQLAFFDTHNVS
jgi:hypothetical protein